MNLAFPKPEKQPKERKPMQRSQIKRTSKAKRPNERFSRAEKLFNANLHEIGKCALTGIHVGDGLEIAHMRAQPMPYEPVQDIICGTGFKPHPMHSLPLHPKLHALQESNTVPFFASVGFEFCTPSDIRQYTERLWEQRGNIEAMKDVLADIREHADTAVLMEMIGE